MEGVEHVVEGGWEFGVAVGGHELELPEAVVADDDPLFVRLEIPVTVQCAAAAVCRFLTYGALGQAGEDAAVWAELVVGVVGFDPVAGGFVLPELVACLIAGVSDDVEAGSGVVDGFALGGLVDDETVGVADLCLPSGGEVEGESVGGVGGHVDGGGAVGGYRGAG